MPGYNGSGIYVRNYSWATDAANGVKIRADRMDTEDTGFATGLSNVICRDGQSTTTAIIPFAGGGIKTDTLGAVTGGGPVTLTDGQVKFPASQNPSSNANTLDDYKEGTFTPTISFGGASVGAAYTTQVGVYTKIGNVCFFQIRLTLSSKGSSTGAALVNALPFTSGSSAYVPALGYYNSMAAGVTTAPAPLIVLSSTTISIGKFLAGSSAQLQDTDFTNTSDLILSGHYAVA